MPHPKPNNQTIELDDDWEEYKRSRHVYADRASYKGFKKLDDMYRALLKTLRKGLHNAEPQNKTLWMKEYQRANKSRDWVLENLQEPVDDTSSRSSSASSKSSTKTKKQREDDTSDSEESVSSGSSGSSGSASSKSSASSVSSESSRSSGDTQRKGLEDDSHKHAINEGLVALSRKYNVRERALVLDAPESKLSSTALCRAGFKQIDVPNMTITAKDARNMSKGPVKWFASQAFDHMAHSNQSYDLIYLDQCGCFLSHMKDVVLAIQKLESGRPVIFATTFFTSRIPSETKNQWKTEHVHQIQALFDGLLNVKVHGTTSFEYRKMVTNVWVVEKGS